ncbi:MAG: DoxX family protein [marine benthic group bacterium]|jgi:putative oxidoreductase|nr:DoxX family protein [Candidatus Benthicola marisminoris]
MDRGVNPDLGLTILRVVLGVIFIAHGAPSIFGGMEGTIALLESQGIPAPTVTAWFISLLGFVGGMCLIAGFLVTPVALLLVVYMMLGIILVHAARGFYVLGPNANGGIEYNLLLAASLLMLVFGGPGLAAMDSRTSG